MRIGIGLYGLSPNPDLAPAASLDLHPVMRLEAPLTQVKRVPAGRAVSYGGTWRAPTDRWLALVPLGYADGIPRAAADGGPVAVAGLRTTIVGRVCMDQVVIDLGPAVDAEGRPLAAPAAAGDVAVLWGDPRADGAGPATPTADEYSRLGHRDPMGSGRLAHGCRWRWRLPGQWLIREEPYVLRSSIALSRKAADSTSFRLATPSSLNKVSYSLTSLIVLVVISLIASSADTYRRSTIMKEFGRETGTPCRESRTRKERFSAPRRPRR